MAKEINLNVRIDEEMYADLSVASQLRDISIAQVVRLAIEDYLRKQKRRSKATESSVSPASQSPPW